MKRRHFLSTSVAAGVSASHSQARNGPKDLRRAGFMGIAKAKKDLPRSARLKVEGDELRILQFTDIHFFFPQCGDIYDESYNLHKYRNKNPRRV